LEGEEKWKISEVRDGKRKNRGARGLGVGGRVIGWNWEGFYSWVRRVALCLGHALAPAMFGPPNRLNVSPNPLAVRPLGLLRRPGMKCPRPSVDLLSPEPPEIQIAFAGAASGGGVALTGC